MASAHKAENEKSGDALPATTHEAISEVDVAPATVLPNAADADDAMKAFAEYQGRVLEIDEATNKRLLRRIDMHMMPVSPSSWLSSS